jgi:hypothetical protein
MRGGGGRVAADHMAALVEVADLLTTEERRPAGELGGDEEVVAPIELLQQAKLAPGGTSV